MPTPVFSPPVNPSFGSTQAIDWPADEYRSQKGYPHSRPLGLRDVMRGPSLSWPVINDATLDYIHSFFQGLNGSRGPFLWDMPNSVPNPTGMLPALSRVSGGALPQRNYWVVFTWIDSSPPIGTLESAQSGTSTITVFANEFLKVEVPVFPTGTTGWRVYVSETQGDEELQASIENSRSWTQAGALSVGVNPPATSDLTSTKILKLAGGIQITPIRAGKWSVSIPVEELLVAS